MPILRHTSAVLTTISACFQRKTDLLFSKFRFFHAHFSHFSVSKIWKIITLDWSDFMGGGNPCMGRYKSENEDG